MIILCGGFAGHIFGDRSLDAGDGKREGQGENGCDKLINTHALGAENI